MVMQIPPPYPESRARQQGCVGATVITGFQHAVMRKKKGIQQTCHPTMKKKKKKSKLSFFHELNISVFESFSCVFSNCPLKKTLQKIIDSHTWYLNSVLLCHRGCMCINLFFLMRPQKCKSSCFSRVWGAW